MKTHIANTAIHCTELTYHVRFGGPFDAPTFDVCREALWSFGYSEDSKGAEQYVYDAITGAPLPAVCEELRVQEPDCPGLQAMITARGQKDRAEIVALWDAHIAGAAL